MPWCLQHERETWRENGIAPPMPGTDAEKYWIEVDKAVPYTKVYSLICTALAVICSCKQRSQDINLSHIARMTGEWCSLPDQKSCQALKLSEE